MDPTTAAMMGGMNALGQAAGPAGPAISGANNYGRVSIGAPVFNTPGTTGVSGQLVSMLPMLAIAAVAGVLIYKGAL